MTKIIVAMDGMSVEETLGLAEKLKGQGALFKVNDQLDDDLGLGIIDELKKYGEVMDDPKLHDIPKTVGRRAAKHAKHKPELITVHASGEIPMMRAAVENCGEAKILAVTVLTSLDEDQCNLTFGSPIKAKVLQFARFALAAGAHGIVCSGQELKFLSGYPETKRLIKVTPGIRPKWHIDPNDDQSRIVTPAEAFGLKADYIVIGRPIVQAKNPVEAFIKTKEEIEAAEKEKQEKEDK